MASSNNLIMNGLNGDKYPGQATEKTGKINLKRNDVKNVEKKTISPEPKPSTGAAETIKEMDDSSTCRSSDLVEKREDVQAPEETLPEEIPQDDIQDTKEEKLDKNSNDIKEETFSHDNKVELKLNCDNEVEASNQEEEEIKESEK
ncbi:hypothetical protein XELAEV_180074942mg, partial [Xenopus laevis]